MVETHSPNVPKLIIIGEVGNRIDYAPDVKASGRITFKAGAGNVLRFAAGVIFHATILVHGSNNLIEIGPHGKITVKGNGQKVTIGERTTFGGVYILSQEGQNVTIGKDCMFSRRIEIRTTDAHSVIDLETGKRVNLPGAIVIGDHVWVGLGCVIGKGAAIPADCIVGTMSFVNKAFSESHAVIAGVPARIVRQGVTWSRERKSRFLVDEMGDWR